MRGLKVFLVITLIFVVLFGLMLVLFPTFAADANMGPKDIPSARYGGITYLALSAGIWYAFRNPKKNVAVVRTLIVLWGLSALVGLYNGITADEQWNTALPNVVVGVILAAALIVFYPRGEKAT